MIILLQKQVLNAVNAIIVYSIIKITAEYLKNYIQQNLLYFIREKSAI